MALKRDGSIRVEGLRDLERNLRALPKATGKRVLRKSLLKGAEPFVEVASRLAPNDPATPPIDLSSSIEASTKGGRKGRRAGGKHAAEVYAGPTREGYPQAIHQEFGTINHPPQAYMRPAWYATRLLAVKVIGSELGNEIRKARQRIARKAARLAAKMKAS